MKNNYSVTVGIPTCYGGESLIATAKSILASKNVGKIQFMVVADRTPIKKPIREKLEKMGVRVFWNEVSGSQFKKIKQMRELCQNDIFISTQDDIIFDEQTIAEIIKTFSQNPDVTMTGAKIMPLKPRGFFEPVMVVGYELVNRIVGNWNRGENYLAASGRCLAFRTNWFRKFRLPETVVNGDMFMYLENKRLGGKFKRSAPAMVYIRCPQHLKDQIGPSSRFQFSKKELVNYFNFDIAKEYQIPFFAGLKAFFNEFVTNPLWTFLYIFLFITTRLKKQSPSTVSNPNWSVDATTKNLK